MKSKDFAISDQLTIKVSKRSSSRRVRLTIGSNGEIRVSIPTWTSYKVGVDFAKSKLDWINKQKPTRKVLEDGQQLGKNHHLRFMPTDKSKITTRLNDIEAIVFYPSRLTPTVPEAQQAAKRVAKKALLAQAKQLLPIRLAQLADKYDYIYSGINIKSLKTRWGSCDSHKNITLNLFLMELPWELIDYVLIHELNHTKVMHHGPKFWAAMDQSLSDSKVLRKALKAYKASF